MQSGFRPAPARISHPISAAAGPGISAALRPVGFLDVLSSAPAESSPRAHCIHARLRRLATKPCKKFGLGCCIFALLQLCALGGMAAAAGPAALQITHRERSLQPGEVVLFAVQNSRPLMRMSLAGFGREFPCFAEDDGLKWTGFLGIDLQTEPGSYRVRVTGMDMDGKTVGGQIVLAVRAKKFPTRTLTVDEQYVSPPAEALDRIQTEREQVSGIFASITPEKFWRGSFLLPVAGGVISAYGKRSVYNGQPRSPHAGVDFRGAVGTPVRSPNAGKVVLAKDLYFSGKTIIIDHGMGLYSYFGHMSALSAKEGDAVKSGDILGRVGATGRATGPHLHWTVRLVETRIDPLSLVKITGMPE